MVTLSDDSRYRISIRQREYRRDQFPKSDLPLERSLSASFLVERYSIDIYFLVEEYSAVTLYVGCA